MPQNWIDGLLAPTIANDREVTLNVATGITSWGLTLRESASARVTERIPLPGTKKMDGRGAGNGGGIGKSDDRLPSPWGRVSLANAATETVSHLRLRCMSAIG
jgi:hypothetical protein